MSDSRQTPCGRCGNYFGIFYKSITLYVMYDHSPHLAPYVGGPPQKSDTREGHRALI